MPRSHHLTSTFTVTALRYCLNSKFFKVELVYFREHINLEFFSFLPRQLNLKKVLVSGGHMEYKVDPEHLKENGGQKICILAMDGAGRVSIYLGKGIVMFFFFFFLF